MLKAWARADSESQPQAGEVTGRVAQPAWADSLLGEPREPVALAEPRATLILIDREGRQRERRVDSASLKDWEPLLAGMLVGAQILQP